MTTPDEKRSTGQKNAGQVPKRSPPLRVVCAGVMAQPHGTQRHKPLSKAVKRCRLGGPTSGPWLWSNACRRPKVSASISAGCSPRVQSEAGVASPFGGASAGAFGDIAFGQGLHSPNDAFDQ